MLTSLRSAYIMVCTMRTLTQPKINSFRTLFAIAYVEQCNILFLSLRFSRV